MKTTWWLTVALLLGSAAQAEQPTEHLANTLPIVGTYFGQGEQSDRFKDDGMPCEVTSRKHVTLSIAADGGAVWQGHNFFDMECDGEQRAIPQSCWVEGTGRITAIKATEYVLVTEETRVSPGPSDALRVVRWKCGRAYINLPTGTNPRDRRCVRVGPVDDPMEEQADAVTCGMSHVFKDLDKATLKLSGRQLDIRIKLLREKTIKLTKTADEPAVIAPTESAPADTSTCPSGTRKDTGSYDDWHKKNGAYTEEFCVDRNGRKHGPYSVSRTDGTRETGRFVRGSREGVWTQYAGDSACGVVTYDNDMMVSAKVRCPSLVLGAFRTKGGSVVKIWLDPVSQRRKSVEVTSKDGDRLRADAFDEAEIPADLFSAPSPNEPGKD